MSPEAGLIRLTVTNGSEAIPERAATARALAKLLGVAPNTVSNHLRLDGAPTPGADGAYDVRAVARFIVQTAVGRISEGAARAAGGHGHGKATSRQMLGRGQRLVGVACGILEQAADQPPPLPPPIARLLVGGPGLGADELAAIFGADGDGIAPADDTAIEDDPDAGLEDRALQRVLRAPRRQIQEIPGRDGESVEMQLMRATARYREAKAALEELRLQRETERWLPRDQVVAEFVVRFASVRRALLALWRRVSLRLPEKPTKQGVTDTLHEEVEALLRLWSTPLDMGETEADPLAILRQLVDDEFANGDAFARFALGGAVA